MQGNRGEESDPFNLSGHGHFDMGAYEQYFAGKLEDLEFSEADVRAALDRLPTAPTLAS